MKRTSLIVLSLLLVCGAPACNDDDGPDGVGPLDTTQGVAFCCENAETVAGAVVAALDVFPDLNGVTLLALMAVEGYTFPGGDTQPPDGFDLGGLGLCPSGTAAATWKDADDSKSLSAGDTFTLDLVECDETVSGTFELAFGSVDGEVIEATMTLDIDWVETFRDTFTVETWRGGFGVEVNRPAASPTIALLTHRVVDPTDGGASLTVALDGRTVVEMGCFELSYSLDLATGGFVLTEPFALFRVPDCGVMTMRGEGLSAFESPNGQYPARGQARLHPEAGVIPCSGLDVPGDGVATNGSTLALTVVNGGAVILSGTDAEGAAFLVNSSWTDLN